MKSIFTPIEFVSPLSEVEVRMTLKELCGSQWDNYPFNGEVEKNSFRFIKNSFENSRGVPKPILLGDFIEQDGKTRVTISVHTRITDIIGFMIILLGTVGIAGYGFVSGIRENIFLAILYSNFVLGLGGSILALDYFWCWLSFHKCIKKIKVALGSIPR